MSVSWSVVRACGNGRVGALLSTSCDHFLPRFRPFYWLSGPVIGSSLSSFSFPSRRRRFFSLVAAGFLSLSARLPVQPHFADGLLRFSLSLSLSLSLGRVLLVAVTEFVRFRLVNALSAAALLVPRRMFTEIRVRVFCFLLDCYRLSGSEWVFESSQEKVRTWKRRMRSSRLLEH